MDTMFPTPIKLGALNIVKKNSLIESKCMVRCKQFEGSEYSIKSNNM
jgi:hypothetical protein